MSLSVTELFLLAMIVIYALPYLAWRIAGKRTFAPLVVIQILTGILLGPGLLGELAPGLHAAIFTPHILSVLQGIAWLAVCFFIFVAGLELDLRAARVHWRETTIVATAALVLPMLAGSLAALLLLQTPGWIGDEGTRLQVILGIGMACAVTALPVLMIFLQQTGLLRTSLGQRVLRYASLDDVAIWAVLAIILLEWDTLLRQVVFLLLFAAAALLMRRIIPRLSGQADRWYVAFGWLFAASLAADWSGLHYTVGAFLAGAVLDSHWFDEAEVDRFRNTILMTLMPVFFLSTGLRTDWETGGLLVVAAAALLLVAAIGGKLAGIHIAGRILGWPKGEATIVGWLLQTKALIMIIFANVLLDHGIITADAFTALLLMALGSTMLTLPVVLPRLARQGGTTPPPP